MRFRSSCLAASAALALASITALASAQPAPPPPLTPPAPAPAAAPSAPALPPPIPPPAPFAGPTPPSVALGGPPGERLERLRAVLAHVDAEATDAHIPVLVGSLAVGGAAIPTGVVLLGRGGDRTTIGGGTVDSDATTIAGAIILGTGIGSVLGGVIQLFVPYGATLELGEELNDAMATGAPTDHVVLAIEQQWAEAAADIRMGRKISGGLGIGVGAVALGAGTVVALAEPEALSGTETAVISSALVFGGALSLVGGLQVFFIETPQEVAWNTYAASTGISRQPLVVAPRLGFAPVPGGAAVSLDGRF